MRVDWGRLETTFFGGNMKIINFVSAILVVAAVLEAQAQVSGGIGRLPSPREELEDRWNRRPPGGGVGAQDQKIVYINRTVRNETLPLRQLAGIGQGYQGALVESVEVRYRGGRGTFHLLADNSVVASEQIYGGYAVLRSYQAIVLDQNTRSLRLQVQGSALIESILIRLNTAGGHPGHPGYPDPGYPDYPDHPGQPGHPGGWVVEQNVYQQFVGINRLDLIRGLNLMNYQGYRIVAVTVEAEAPQGRATLQLFANQFSQSYAEVRGPWSQPYTMGIGGPAVIGHDIRQLYVETSGVVRIQRIRVQLAR
jgi:hypothetical protein